MIPGAQRSHIENAHWITDLGLVRMAAKVGDHKDALELLRELEREVLNFTPPAGPRTKAREKVLRWIARIARSLESRV